MQPKKTIKFIQNNATFAPTETTTPIQTPRKKQYKKNKQTKKKEQITVKKRYISYTKRKKNQPNNNHFFLQ